jgi:hypothetical protein
MGVEDDVAPHIKRMLVELVELNEKLEKLNRYLMSDNREDYEGVALKLAQASAMLSYATILKLRLKKEGVELL